jgi:hypothetical protein
MVCISLFVENKRVFANRMQLRFQTAFLLPADFYSLCF